MTSAHEDSSVPIFELDQPQIYGQYILTNRREILFHLSALEQRHNLLSMYFNDGSQFMLTSLLNVDEANDRIILDASNQPDQNQHALAADLLTLTASLDRIKIQFRLARPSLMTWNKKAAFYAPLPNSLLRLQRREFFRVATPKINPLRCKLPTRHANGGVEVLDLPLFDISGGGLSLIGSAHLAEKFSLGELLHDCRLEIPGENVLSVNLRIREILKLETPSGEHQLRLGCEFTALPGTRLALIERFITRLEREQKVKEIGSQTPGRNH